MTSRSLLVLFVLVAVGAGYCAGESRGASRERGKAIQRVVDSAARQVAKAETVYLAGKDRWHKAKATWDTVRLTDTIPVRVEVPGKPDTVEIYVPRAVADSAVRACTRLIQSCDERNAAQVRLIAAQDSVIRWERSQRPSTFWTWVKLGLAYLAGWFSGR